MKNKIILSILIVFGLFIFSVDAVDIYVKGTVNVSEVVTSGDDLCVTAPGGRQCQSPDDDDADIRLEPHVPPGSAWNGSSVFATPKGYLFLNTHAKNGIVKVVSQDGTGSVVGGAAKFIVDGIMESLGFVLIDPFEFRNYNNNVLGIVRNNSWELYTTLSTGNETVNLNDGLRAKGSRYGIYGNSNGSSGDYNYGVFGEVTKGSGSIASGVYGYVNSSNTDHLTTVGVLGEVNGVTGASDYAIKGYIPSGGGYSIYASGGSGVKINSGDVRIENGAMCLDDDSYCTPGIKGEIDAGKFNVNSNPDIAEMFYTPNAQSGDVVCVTSANTFGWCNENDYRVAGIVSTSPGFLLNSKCGGHNAVEVRAGDIEDGVYDHEGNRIPNNELIGYEDDPNACDNWLPIALQGRVPAKVDCSNTINPGDRLVTSSTNGHLKKYTGDNAGDLLVARALESCASETGVINVWI